ncbi:MAG: hypothetical protein OXC46_00200 [Thaumarchaeota archaeon]|nr:hypothetical protein [Nitrososphaerota archaeon]
MKVITCVKCKQKNPASHFNKSHKKNNGLQSWCKKCTAKAVHELRHEQRKTKIQAECEKIMEACE